MYNLTAGRLLHRDARRLSDHRIRQRPPRQEDLPPWPGLCLVHLCPGAPVRGPGRLCNVPRAAVRARIRVNQCVDGGLDLADGGETQS